MTRAGRYGRTESLENLERGRSGYIDLSAYGDISCEELRAKVAEVDEQREALQKALREARDHQKTIQKLQRAGEVAFRQFAAMRSMDLHHLDLEDRRRVYLALKLRGEVDKDGDVRISRLFDADITQVPPMAQALADETYTKHFHYEILPHPPPLKGAITVDDTRGPVFRMPKGTRAVDTMYRSHSQV